MYEKLGQWLSHRNPPNEPIPAADYFASLPRLTTDRLLLRPLTMRDAADMFAYSRDPEVARHVLWDAHKSMADTRGCLRYIISQYHSGAPSSWGIVLRETNRVVGTIGFMSYNDADSVVELGYSLARSCWNGGLMTEALAAVLRECFTVLRLHRVEAMHECDNPASGRVMEKMRYAPRRDTARQGVQQGQFPRRGAVGDAAGGLGRTSLSEFLPIHMLEDTLMQFDMISGLRWIHSSRPTKRRRAE